MGESAYDRQLQRAWRGDYSAAIDWTAPSMEPADPAPADARTRSRREIESIVEGEAETIPISRKEAPMKLAKFVKFREEKFGGVLFETRNEKVYTLNPTGAAVVREIVSGSPDVVAALQGRFEDKDGKIAAEAQAFLDELKSKGLVEA